MIKHILMLIIMKRNLLEELIWVDWGGFEHLKLILFNLIVTHETNLFV